MRVRISFDALRLCALVAAGASSGYLWRAAFESSTPEVRVAATPRVVHPAPAPKVVRIPPSRLVPHKVAARNVTQPHPATTVLVTAHPAAAAPVGPAPAPQSSVPQPSAPQPKPQPKPPPAPAPAPAPAPPPAPATSPPAPTQSTPTVQAAAAPAQPASPSNQPNLGNSTNDTRPGWGKGDKNHEHSGPGNGP
jgi:hypothetical protein